MQVQERCTGHLMKRSAVLQCPRAGQACKCCWDEVSQFSRLLASISTALDSSVKDSSAYCCPARAKTIPLMLLPNSALHPEPPCIQNQVPGTVFCLMWPILCAGYLHPPVCSLLPPGGDRTGLRGIPMTLQCPQNALPGVTLALSCRLLL